MKNYTLLFIVIAGVFSLGCFAQRSDHFPANPRIGNAQLMPDDMANNDLAVVSYRVEERINMNFGSTITTYEVSNINLVGTNDLGGTNTRIITPKYGKVRAKVIAIASLNEQPMTAIKNALPVVAIPSKVDRTPPKSVNIDILSTYERIIDKGYKSLDMLKRVANSRYFDGDLEIAAKYYTQLFELTTDLEPVFFFRYAQSLKAANQVARANEMMELYELKNK